MENLPSLKRPGQSQDTGMALPSTPTFFPTNREKLHRRHTILDTMYDIPATTSDPICLVSIVPHLHGEIPIAVCKQNGKVKDVNVIVKRVPNDNTLSTRLMAPAGREHIEHHEGDDECPHYNSSLRIIYVSRMRMFSNVQCLSGLMVSETEKERFLPRDFFLDDTRTGYSQKGVRSIAADSEFHEYIHDPNYCKYYSRKNEYVEKICISKPEVEGEQSFGFYIDVAIIRPKNETTSTVTVKTFILSNKSPEFSEASHRYIEELLIRGNPDIKQRLHEFIESGVCKLSNVIDAVSSYTKAKGIENGNTEIFLTDLSCSVYKTFNNSPRERISIEPQDLTLIQVEEMNQEIKDELYTKHGIPTDYPDDYMNDDGDGFDNGCGVLYLSDIDAKRLSKSQLEKREYDKIFQIIRGKLPELRTRVASGFSFFNKKQRRTKRRPRTRRTRRSKRRGTKRRGTNRRGTKRRGTRK